SPIQTPKKTIAPLRPAQSLSDLNNLNSMDKVTARSFLRDARERNIITDKQARALSLGRESAGDKGVSAKVLRAGSPAQSIGLGFATGLGRSVVGTAEGISGLYDLAAPGSGQNRFGKIAQSKGAQFDEFNKTHGLNRGAYKGGQL